MKGDTLTLIWFGRLWGWSWLATSASL